MNTCMALSTFSNTSIEDVAKVNERGLRWLNLMLTLPDDYLREHIKQAERSGYKAFVITVDQPNVPLSRKNSRIAKMGVATFPLFKPLPSESVVEKISWINASHMQSHGKG